MKRTFKYQFLSRHPELQTYMDDLSFLTRVGREAEDDPRVSAAVVFGISALCDYVLQAFARQLLTVSPLHDRMELELKYENDGSPYLLVKEDVSSDEVSRN